MPSATLDLASPAPPGGRSQSASRALPRLALLAVAALAGAKLALHLAFTGRFGYGFFVDELYYLALTEHLDLGYVDLPPLFPALLAAWRTALGDSLAAVRLLPAFAGAGLVVLTAGLTRALGGGRFAQALAGLAVITAPIYLVMHDLATMNALEPLIWTAGAWLLVRLAAGADPRLWLAFGALAGVGMLNKHSFAFFGVAALAAVLLTPLRGGLRERWIWLGGLTALTVFLPNLAWEVAHGFPHLEQLANIQADGRDVRLSALAFLAQQALLLHPVALPLWLGGLGWTLFAPAGRRFRVIGWTYLGILAEMLLLAGRVYYPAPAYPMLFAAGAVAFDGLLSRLRPRRAAAVRVGAGAVLVAAGALLAPLVLPCLPPAVHGRYTRRLGFDQPRIETHELGPLPQLLADRFGWPEMAAVVARAYHSLPAAEQAKAAIFGQNYGQAGSIDLFGPRLGLPKAISGHLTYHLWGPRGATGEVVIVLDDDRETLEAAFANVEPAGHVFHPYSMPYQHFDVWICRGLKVPIAELWPRVKHYD